MNERFNSTKFNFDESGNRARFLGENPDRFGTHCIHSFSVGRTRVSESVSEPEGTETSLSVLQSLSEEDRFLFRLLLENESRSHAVCKNSVSKYLAPPWNKCCFRILDD